ncbi:MAG: hypothetical protein RL007_731 [Bacteroidota bacterium]|jgi:SiaC family regulatory phosphoprotein
MIELNITPTLRTAEVSFDQANGILEFSGISIPENADAFFQPVYTWLEKIQPVHKGAITVRINLTYFNTSSVRHLLIILKALIAAFRDRIKVEWVYEADDEEIRERGEQLSEVVKFPFNYITIG